MAAGYICDIVTGTPVGAVMVVSRGGAVVAVEMGHASEAAARRRAQRRFGAVEFARSKAGRELREYFAGKRQRFTVKADLSRLPIFHRKTLRACAKVPFGKVVTYGELAAAAGSPRAARAAGAALASNPCGIVVPCHRVVGSSGLGGFSARGGVRTKRALLRFEGVQCGA